MRFTKQAKEVVFQMLPRFAKRLPFFQLCFLKKALAVMFVVLLSGCVFRGSNLREGIRNFQIQNYRHAFLRLLPEAEKGNPDAQYAVGYMYYYGQGVVEDRQKAAYWIKCAAHSGQPDAMSAVHIIETQR